MGRTLHETSLTPGMSLSFREWRNVNSTALVEPSREVEQHLCSGVSNYDTNRTPRKKNIQQPTFKYLNFKSRVHS